MASQREYMNQGHDEARALVLSLLDEGTVTKSAEGWARFRDKTDNGTRKRPAVAHPSHFRPAQKGGR